MQFPASACTVDGYRLAYVRAGRGEVVVLVHGITTNSFIWGGVFEPLAEHYDVIAVDLLGCGASDLPIDTDLSIAAHADRLFSMVEELGIGRCHLVGHDVGGGIAQRFAVARPERLHDLTLVNSIGFDLWPVQPIVALRTPIIRRLVMATLDLGTLRMVVRRGLHQPDRLTEDLMGRFWQQMGTSPARRAFLHFARCLDNRQLTEISDDLGRLDLPVLIVRGEGDRYLSPEISRRLADTIPGATLRTLDAAGHFIQLDAPEWLAATLLAFFEGAAHD